MRQLRATGPDAQQNLPDLLRSHHSPPLQLDLLQHRELQSSGRVVADGGGRSTAVVGDRHEDQKTPKPDINTCAWEFGRKFNATDLSGMDMGPAVAVSNVAPMTAPQKGMVWTRQTDVVWGGNSTGKIRITRTLKNYNSAMGSGRGWRRGPVLRAPPARPCIRVCAPLAIDMPPRLRRGCGLRPVAHVSPAGPMPPVLPFDEVWVRLFPSTCVFC